MACSQLSLFPTDQTDQMEDRVETNHFHVTRSTFLGGLSASVHRWFRLTPSFGPDLVSKALADMNTLPHSVVLDPFAGAGTTLIEARFEGHDAIGFEVNPLLYFVCRASLEWTVSPTTLRLQLAQIERTMERERHSAARLSPEELGLTVPPIHNVYRWWRPDVLKDLMILLAAIRHCSQDSRHRDFFELALAGVLVPHLTNVTLGRLQLHFIDRSGQNIQVWPTFHQHALKMIRDLEEIECDECALESRGLVFHTDATAPKLTGTIPLVDRVVTSPPYPNRYSYVWNTRPHLYLLGMFESAKEASDLDVRTIGGTWGSATSVLLRGEIEPAYPVIAKEIRPVVEQIRASDNLMANYVMKYFNKLTDQIVSQDPLLANQAQLAYVVGCSRIKEVYVETDVLLGKIFEGLNLGYRVTRIERFRHRHSGKDLHESTVYASKG